MFVLYQDESLLVIHPDIIQTTLQCRVCIQTLLHIRQLINFEQEFLCFSVVLRDKIFLSFNLCLQEQDDNKNQDEDNSCKEFWIMKFIACF